MASLRDYKPLRLMAADGEDLKVISSMLQDSVAKIGDFAHDAEARRFAFVANRFLWECAGDRKRGVFARVRSGCHFDDVMSVKTQNLRMDAGDAVVDLLAVRFEEGEEGAGLIYLEFAGGGAIRLEVESVNTVLRDISEPWRTRARPDHED